MAKKDEQQSVSEQASVAPTEGTQKRSIQMKFFASDVIKANVAAAYAAWKAGDDSKQPEASKTLGQIVGQIVDVKERSFENKDGSVSVALQAIGDFEAVNYATGEVISSGIADLPKYYLESIKSILDKSERTGGPGAMLCALEIVLVATGKNIPVAYEIRNLVQRPAESPLNRLKAQMAAAGRLRLPPPVEPEKAVLPAPSGEYIDGETGELIPATPEGSDAGAEKQTS